MIDSHQHFWNKDEVSYHWLSPESGKLYRNFVPSDLLPLTQAAGVEKTVVVQATNHMGETDWLLKQASENDFIGGVVAWVDLKDENLAETLAELKKNPKLKGVRHQIEDEPNREWMLQEEVLRGLKIVEESGLAFDALLKMDQLWQLKTVVEKCPNLPIVIDHCAKPDIAAGGFDEWAPLIAEAAKLPVMCKLSGLLTEASADWTVEEIQPYADYILEIFGEDRVMFGSDWPVSTLASEYVGTVEAFKALLADLDDNAKEKVFDKNARKFYKI